MVPDDDDKKQQENVDPTNPAEKEPANPVYDPFDPAGLKLSQNFSEGLSIQQAVLTVPVQRPPKECWIRVHPDEEFRLTTMVLESKLDREIYLVAHQLWSALRDEPTVSSRILFRTITRQGVQYLWPIRLPGQDGRIDPWNESALQAAQNAMTRWMRVSANMHLGAYDVREAIGAIPDPDWPDNTMRDLLEAAFKNKVIDSPDHPMLRRLRGEI